MSPKSVVFIVYEINVLLIVWAYFFDKLSTFQTVIFLVFMVVRFVNEELTSGNWKHKNE